MRTTRRRLVRLIGILCVALAAPGTLAQSSGSPAHRSGVPGVIGDPAPDQRPLVEFQSIDGGAGMTTTVGGAGSLNLPPATTSPAPAPPSITGPLGQHEVFGFAPYWGLPIAWKFDFLHLSTVAYFGLDAGRGGSLVTTGPGWNGYASQDLVDLVTRAHQAGDRAVLVVKTFDEATLDSFAADPVGAGTRLGEALVAALRAKAMDGVNLDFEGLGAADRAGFARFVAQVAAIVHRADPRYQLSIDTYGGSATDPGGFFDIAALAPSVDAFFVMAYDMESPRRATPNAPLSGGGPNDTAEVKAYSSVVPPSKVVLGVPFYGYDWTTTSGAPGAAAVSRPTPETYANIASAGRPELWDPQGAVPWTSYEVGGAWHETYYDNPTSVGLKAWLATAQHLAGVGVWALGMDGNNPAMLGALVGQGASKNVAPEVGSSSTLPAPPQQGATPSATLPWGGGPATTSSSATTPAAGNPPSGVQPPGSPTTPPASLPPALPPDPLVLASTRANQVIVQATASDGEQVSLLTGSGCFVIDVAGRAVAGSCSLPPRPALADPPVLAASDPLPSGAFAVVRAAPGATAITASTAQGASAPALLTPDGWGLLVTEQAMTAVVAIDSSGKPVGQVAVPPVAGAGPP